MNTSTIAPQKKAQPLFFFYPNVDFYSGIIYSAIGIPRAALRGCSLSPRTVGWALTGEMISRPNMRSEHPGNLTHGCP